MRGRRNAVAALGNAAGHGDLLGYLGARQHAAMARLGPLAQLDLDHLYLIDLRSVAEARGVEMAVVGAATEIAAADFQHQVAAVRAVVTREAAFTGVVIEIAEPGPLVKRLDRVRRKRAEAHRRDVEQRGRIARRALRRADIDAPFLRRM